MDSQSTVYELPLDEPLKSEGWKIKIRLKERVEAPHVTVMKGPKVWPINLRNFDFLDEIAPPRKLPKVIGTIIRNNICRLRKEWDKKYAQVNPVNVPCPLPEHCEVCHATD